MAVSSNWGRFIADQQKVIERTQRAMAQVVLYRSRMLAPIFTGALVDDGRVENNPQGGLSVLYGSPKVPYARRRHYENRKNPQTLYFLQRAGESVAKENVKKYVEMSK